MFVTKWKKWVNRSIYRFRKNFTKAKKDRLAIKIELASLIIKVKTLEAQLEAMRDYLDIDYVIKPVRRKMIKRTKGK